MSDGQRNAPGGETGGAQDRWAATTDILGDLDAYAEHLNGRFVVQVVVDAERDHRRTYLYRNIASAEAAVRRANDRGQRASVTLVKLVPVGVVAGLGVGK